MKIASRVLLSILMLVQVFGNLLISDSIPSAYAYNFIVDPPLASPETNCAFEMDEVRYDNETFTIWDTLQVNPTNYFWVVNQAASRVKMYNAARLNNPTFEQLSEIVPFDMPLVYVARSMGLQVKALKNGTPNEAQVVFKIVRTAYSQDEASNPGKVYTTSNTNFPQFQFTNGRKAKGAPVAGSEGFNNPQFENECYNITINYCGDGIVQSNHNEVCDDGNQNNNDSCKNDCTPTPAPVCVEDFLTPTTPPLQVGQNIQIKCGAPTGFTAVTLAVKKNGVMVPGVGGMQSVSEYTYNFTLNQPGDYTYECIETYNVPSVGAVNCGGAFSLATPPASCVSLTLTPPNGGLAPFSFTYDCEGDGSSQYSVNVSSANGFNQTLTTPGGTLTNLQAGLYNVSCTVGGNQNPSSVCNEDFNVTSPVVIPPDMSITKTVSGPTTVNSGDIVTYNITVTNTSPAGAPNIKSWKLEDTIPAGQIYNAGYTSVGGNGNKCGNLANQPLLGQIKQATINGASLAIGESCTYTLKTKVVSATPPTQINEVCVNTVVGSGNINRTSTEKCATADITINQPVNSFCNSLAVTANPGNIAVQNGVANPINAFPVNLSFTTNWGGNAISCMLIELVNNTMVTRATTGAGNGTFNYPINNENVYWVKCVVDGIQPEGAGYAVNTCKMDFWFNSTKTIDLEIDKQHMNGNQSCETYNSGDLVGFQIIVHNNDNATTGARNFTVKDYLPANYQFFSASNGGTNAGGTVSRTIPGPLNPGQSMTLYMTGRVTAEGNYSNKAEVCNYEEGSEPQDGDSNPCTMTSSGTPSEDDEDVLCYVVNNPVTPYIDIELEKAIVSPQGMGNMFDSGTVITFSVTVHNYGNTIATGFVVKDYLPLASIYNVTASNQGVVTANLVTWTIPSLGVGETMVLTVQGTLKYSPINPDPCNKAEAGDYEDVLGEPQDPDSDEWTMGPNGTGTQDDEDSVNACFWVNHPENYDIELDKVLMQPNGNFTSGGLVGFKLTLYNNSSVDIPTFGVKDYLPAGLQFVSATDGGTAAGQTVSWTIQGGLGAYGTKILYLTGKILYAGQFDNCAEVGAYNGVSSLTSPKDIDSNPYNHPGQDVEDDESCVPFDVPPPNNPVSCDSLTVSPLSGSAPLTVTYDCSATNATTYTIQLIQNGIVTNIGTNPNGTYTINNPGAYQIKCLVNNTISNPACQTNLNVGETPYIDLNIQKFFNDNNSKTHANFNSGDTISFKLIVGNSGNATATNFTVKDYLPSSLQYISSTPNGVALGNNQYQWSIASLAPGQSTTITIQAKIILALWDKNRTEVCAYEEAGELQDPDSDPCNMGPDGMPSEDDEDMIMRDVDEPNPSASCDNLTIDPSTGTVPYSVNYTCTGTNAQNYTIKLFGGSFGVNGLIVGSANQGSFTLSTTGSYTVQCLVNGTVTSAACNKTLIGTTTPPPASTGTKCNYMTVTPNGGTDPLTVNFFCNGGYTSTNTSFPLQYVINISGPNGFTQSYVSSGGSILLDNPGLYSFACSVGGATAPACNKNVTVVTGACTNGATNPPVCNQCPPGEHLSGGMCVPCADCIPNCPPGQIFSGNQCVIVSCPPTQILSGGQCICPSGNVLSGTICVIPNCTNGASNPPACNQCPSGYILSNGQCVIASCTNGAINPPSCNLCPPGKQLINGQCVIPSCTNGATNYPACNQCPSGLVYTNGQCVPPPPANHQCDVQCLDLQTSTQSAVAGQTVNFSCTTTGASTSQIWIYANGSTTPLSILQGPTASYTFANAGSYTAQCIVNGSVDYKCDYFKNYCLDNLACAYKIRPGGALCAVKPTLEPFQITFVPLANWATIPAPVEYCTPSELTSLQCYTNNNNLSNIGAVKNKDVCKDNLTITQGVCTNGAINPPACNQCPSGYILSNGQCVIEQCSNGAINPPLCNQCPTGYSMVNGVCRIDGFNYCGNGIVEIGEDCDIGNTTDRTIRNGSYRGQVCTTSCRLQGATNPPKCMDIDPPSINEGEFFPFWWNVDTNKVTLSSSCNTSDAGKVLASSMQCTFKIYNGKRGTTDPISTFTIPCNSDKGFDTTLMRFWRDKQDVKPFGRYVTLFDSAAINGIYGEYKIELNKITYSVCGVNGTQSYDGTVCQYNFVVGDGYMIQKGATVSTLKDNSIIGYYGFSSNTPRFDLYLKGVTQSLTLSAFNPTKNMSYLVTDFVDKYDKLANNAGVGKKKVPGKKIYLYENSTTLKDTDVEDDSTIIVKNGNLRLEGTIAKNIMYIVPNGTITLGGDANCEKYTDDPLPQIVQGILVAGKGFASDYYLNTNSSKARCSNGGLKIRGTLIGGGVDKLIDNRRVVLNDWFEGATFEYKVQHILDGASLLINPNVTLWTTLPGADEVASVLGVEKK